MCMFSWLFVTEQPFGVPFSGKNLPLPAFLGCLYYSSLCRVERWWPFSHPVWYVNWCHPHSVPVWAIMLIRLYGFGLWCYYLTESHSKLPDSLALTISLPLGVVLVCMLPLILCSKNPHFEWLWFSVVVSVCCKEKFPCCGVKITLVCNLEMTLMFPPWGLIFVVPEGTIQVSKRGRKPIVLPSYANEPHQPAWHHNLKGVRVAHKSWWKTKAL